MITIIKGDFNVACLWNQKADVLNLEDTRGLRQIIKEPTETTSHSCTLIDIIFCTHENKVVKSGVLGPICTDHCPVFAHVSARKTCNDCNA